MSLIAIPRSRLRRRSAVAALGIGVAASLTVATVLNPKLADAFGDQVSQGIGSLKTVAAMLAERSPGQRPEGALANLKRKRQSAALHERALPKIRGPISPIYEALAGPLSPPAVPPAGSLFNSLAAGPPETMGPITPGTFSGPPILGEIPPPGGGGGGFFVPPVVTTAAPELPATPVEALPEPASWAMMLIGFALIGRMLRRRPIAGAGPALE